MAKGCQEGEALCLMLLSGRGYVQGLYLTHCMRKITHITFPLPPAHSSAILLSFFQDPSALSWKNPTTDSARRASGHKQQWVTALSHKAVNDHRQ